MPWTYDIKPEVNLVQVKASGVLTTEELVKGVRAAYQDPRFDSDLDAFLDYSEVTEWQVDSVALAHLAATRKFSDNSRTAIWAVGALNFGMVRIYHAWVEKGRVMVFQDRDEALAWLDQQ